MNKLLEILVIISILLVLFACSEKQPLNNIFDPDADLDDLAPSNIEFELLDINNLQISWKDNSANEEGFIIERKTYEGNWIEIGIAAENITSFIDSTIAQEEIYYYRIYAFEQETKSTFSEAKPYYSNFIIVPEHYSTIQNAINSAVNEDIILVFPGTYNENINFQGKNIIVSSLFLVTQNNNHISATIISGNNNDSVIKFNANENETAMLNGFSIINGQSEYGAGIYCSNSNPTLSNLDINSNSAYGEEIHSGAGAGVYCSNSNPIINNVKIQNNSAYVGGGIYCINGSNVSFTNVLIVDNAITEWNIELYFESSNVTVMNSIIWNNLIGYTNVCNEDINYSNLEGYELGIGNINLDPLFMSSGNYHLQSNSPCINTGNPDSQYNDMDGSRNDMGAYGGPNGNW